MTLAALFYISLAAVAFAALLAVASILGRHRRVVCPETGTEVDVTIDPKHAAKAVFTGEHLRIADCERWPERKDCARDCAKKIHA